jgi:hypothetical protein
MTEARHIEGMAMPAGLASQDESTLIKRCVTDEAEKEHDDELRAILAAMNEAESSNV